MFKSIIVLLSFFCVVFCTPLDDYVNAPDPSYKYELNSTIRGEFLGYTAYVLKLTSQTWMSPAQSDRSVWEHWLVVCVPNFINLDQHTAFMYIDGGHNNDAPPTSVDALAEVICVMEQSVSAALLQIPNEPITFANDGGKRRSEDSLIAYTWWHFIHNTSDPTWLARLPMTKAAVKAMDAIQNFTSTLNHVPRVDDFVIAGASKRGWTTWTTGAVDKRVRAMVPMVMPILNIVPNLNHHFQAYDGWSFAFADYLALNLTSYLNDPVFLEMAAIVDPYSYRSRLTMPKLILCAAGDEFFLPDSPQFFMSTLPGENLLTVIPDAEHSLATALPEVGNSIATYFHLITQNIPRPIYHYKINKSNTTASIVVTTEGIIPTAVTMWYAYSWGSVKRDFRLVACDQIPECIQPVMWWPQTLKPTSPNTYIATMDAPPRTDGWIGFLVELTYEFSHFHSLRISSEVNIVPDFMPFPPCGHHC